MCFLKLFLYNASAPPPPLCTHLPLLRLFCTVVMQDKILLKVKDGVNKDLRKSGVTLMVD